MINEQVNKVKNIKRKQLVSTNKRTIQNCIPLTYDRYLPNILNIITKNRNILQILPNLQNVIDKKTMITYKRSQNLGEFIGGHTLQGGKVFKTHFQLQMNLYHATQQINHLYAVHK